MRGLFWLLALLPLLAAAQDFVVPEGFWLSPRSGAAVLAEPAIVQAVRHFLDYPGARLVLHHARGDEASAQAEELRGWLIALGLEANAIELLPEGASGRPLRIEVIPSTPSKVPE